MRTTLILALAGLTLAAACKKSTTGPAANTGTLTVVVTTTGGTAVNAAEVHVEPGARMAQTNAQGSVTFAGLTAGQYTVSVQGATGSAIQQVSFAPPASEVRLTLGDFVIQGAGITVQWGAPESLRAVIPSNLIGEVVWTSLNDLYLDLPVELGRGPAVFVGSLRPGTTTVEARLVSGGQIVARATAQVTVQYRESWNVQRLGLVSYPVLSVGDVFVVGRNALVARRGFHGFSVVDIDAIQEIGRFQPDSGFAQDVHAVGNLAYLTNEGGVFRHAVTIVDITNPRNPVEVGGIPTSLPTSSAHTVFVDGTIAYVANSPSRQIHVWNVANPAAPFHVSTVSSTNGIAHEAYVRNGILFGAYMQLTPTTVAELVIARMTDPSAPAILARVTYPNARLTHSVSTSEDGRYLFVVDEVTNAPIRIFDIMNPAAPVLVGTYRPRLGTVPHHFVVRDDIAYLSMYKNGLEIVDVSDPTRPRMVGFFDTHDGVASDGSTGTPSAGDLYRGAWGVDWTDDGKIVVSDMDKGLFVLRYGG